MSPIEFDQLQLFNFHYKKGYVHAHNTYISKYFQRYLFQKCISVFKWSLPDNWNLDYFLYVLYGLGYIGILQTDEFGVIPQYCIPTGYNIFYQPKMFRVTNPNLNKMYERTIGKDAVIIKLTPDWCGVMDIINIYADMMAIALEAGAMNINNSKLAYVFGADNKASAETFKKMMDQIMSGCPAVSPDIKMFDKNGNAKWFTFANNLRQNFIAPEIMQTLSLIENKFDAEIGLPNNPVEKKERLVTDEVNSNNESTFSKCQLWLDNIQIGIDQVATMFPGNIITCEFRSDAGKEVSDDGDNDTAGDVLPQ